MKLFPLNRLAFQSDKLDTDVALEKGFKPRSGVPVLQISREQDFLPDRYIVWFYEQVPIKTYLYAALALVGIFAVVLFPLWPLALRRGVWYLSMGMLGLIGAFFGLAIIRLVLYLITVVVAKPGIWIFPNLFEDLGVLESFVPFWSWEGEDAMKIHRLSKKKKKSKKQKEKKLLKQQMAALGKDAPNGKGQTQAAAQAAANAALMKQFQEINVQVEAKQKERQEAGNPMTPEESANFARLLLAQYSNGLRGAGAPGIQIVPASAIPPVTTTSSTARPNGKTTTVTKTAAGRSVTIEELDDDE